MIESESVLKTVTGEKTFRLYGDIGKCTDKSAVSSKDFNDEVRDLNERFELKFHLQRADFEKWISIVLKDESIGLAQKRLITA